MMDWAAKMFGLDDCFLNSSEIGGGVIQVCMLTASCLIDSYEFTHFGHSLTVDHSFRRSTGVYRGGSLGVCKAAPPYQARGSGDLHDDSDSLTWPKGGSGPRGPLSGFGGYDR